MMEIEAENSIKKDIVNYIIVLLLAVGIGYAVSIYGIALGTTLLALPFAIALIIMIFRNPKIGLLVTLNYSFF